MFFIIFFLRTIADAYFWVGTGARPSPEGKPLAYPIGSNARFVYKPVRQLLIAHLEQFDENCAVKSYQHQQSRGYILLDPDIPYCRQITASFAASPRRGRVAEDASW
jgi:hypothetical protein